ncbi:hypothetical protein [Gemmiger sp.]|uniref:hypothetical protein n=1 Tax=Gemmiger sp. TaxID=2049027 RepID=UPI0027DB5980|nr:hypothetical protein [Gemmiger sp.]MDY2695238.1 hypothetical protein [Gemmiger sp.]MDY6007089.1 hypothetical protein [Gemmiger sp.]
MIFTILVVAIFCWLGVKSIGLALHLAWGAAKIIACLLMVVALPLLIIGAVVGGLIKLALPLLLVLVAYEMLKTA